jgi:hypothetical protein
MKKLLIFLIIAILCSVGLAVKTIRYTTVSNPVELDVLLRDIHGNNRNAYTFGNGLILDNLTNNAFEITENSESLILTFGTNDIAVTTDTGITAIDVETIVFELDSLLFEGQSAYPTATEGRFYYDDANNVMTYRSDSAWVALSAGTGDNTLDAAYDQGSAGGGKKVDVDSGAIEFEVDDAADNPALHLDCDNVTNDPTALLIENAADAANAISIDIDAQTTGRDIEGTGASFYVEGDGSVVCVDLDATGAGGLTLQNDATILNDADNEIQIGDGSEDISFGFGTSDTLTMTTDTSVGTVAWGDLDAHTGLNTVAFDAAASTVTLAADGAGDDLTIQVTGTQNSSLFLTSAGTAADAIRMNASDGGLDLDAADGIAIDVAGATGEDFVVTNSGGSIKLEATEGVADAIVFEASTAAGGIDIISNADIDITTTGTAGEDISITNTGGSINITATENNSGAIDIEANGGTSEMVRIYANQGTSVTEGAASVTLLSDDGGISLKSTANLAKAIQLVTDAGTTETIFIQADQGNAVAQGSASIQLLSDAGGININAVGNTTVAEDAGSISLVSDAGGISIHSEADLAKCIQIVADGGTSETIYIQSDQGTGTDSITIISDAGGIDMDSNDDFALTVTSAGAGEDMLLTQVGANDSGIILETAGTGADAIGLNSSGTGGGISVDTDDGAISIVADGAANGDITIDAQDRITIVSTDADAGGGIYIHANGGVNEDIDIHADQGTATDSIKLTSDVGGITVWAQGANGAGVVIINSALVIDANTATFGAADATPDVSGHSYFLTGGADTYTDFDAGSGSLQTGHIIFVKSAHAAVFDTTSSGLKGSSVDITTASGDLTSWIYDGTDWILTQFTDVSADNSGGT